jgi:hypothetical protein
MSYDIYLIDSKTRNVVCLNEPLDLRGGIMQQGGTCEAWINVTYNYSPFFKRVLGEKGIRSIYGMKAAESIPLLVSGSLQLKGYPDCDYWKATEGNAKEALNSLITLATACPDAEWTGD